MSRRPGSSIPPPENQSSNRRCEGLGLGSGQYFEWPFVFATQAGIDPTPKYSHRFEWGNCCAARPAWLPEDKPPSRANRAVDGHGPGPRKRESNSTATQRPDMVVELALHGLHKALCSALVLFQSYSVSFDGRVQQLAGWADDSSLDLLWRNMVADMFRKKGEMEKFNDAGEKISASLEAVRQAAKGEHATKTYKQHHSLERRLRAAHKAVAHCEAIVKLAERVENERMAGKFVIEEIMDAVAMLDPKTHPQLYGDEYENKGKGREQARAQDYGKEPSFSNGSSANPPQDENENGSWGDGNQDQ